MVRCVETALSNARRRAPVQHHHAEDGGQMGRTAAQLRNVLAALASMSARRSLALSRCRLQNTSTYIQQRSL